MMLDNNGRFLLLRPQIWLKDYSADAGLSCAQIVISKRTCLPGEWLSYPFAILSYHFMSTKLLFLLRSYRFVFTLFAF